MPFPTVEEAPIRVKSAPGPALAKRPAPAPSPRKARFLKTLRKLHAWIGLSGAAFGLLFGFTGILMNHRSVMKIPLAKTTDTKAQVELDRVPDTPEALAADLAARLGFRPDLATVKVQKGKPALMAGAEVRAAEVWTIQFRGHAHHARASFVPGNRTADVEIKDPNAFAVLNRLHKADAEQVGWVLLSDAFVGSFLFLTLSGVLLWTRLAGSKLLAAGLALGGILALVLVAAQAW